jgi:hypothetical protein
VSRYDAWYLVVAGRLWLRHTSEPAVWFADFTDTPTVRKERYAGELPFADRVSGAVAGASWDVRVLGGGPPFSYVPAPLAPLASTQVVLERPAATVDGVVEVEGRRYELRGAPAQVAHVGGRRHADRWGWFHAPLARGGWLDGLVAKSARLPQLAFYVRDGRRRWTSGSAEPGRVRIGSYVVEANPGDFVGVTYHDPDGSEVFCWHTERGRLSGGGLVAEGVALEFGSRAKVDGWPISI